MVRESALAVLVLVILIGVAAAGERPPAQSTCPISGKPVNGSFYADVDGFRIYTAGPAEADAVRANPGRAFAALAKNRQAAVPSVWKCPSMLRPVAPNFPFVQQAGKRIYYCCAPCQSRIKKDFNGAADTLKRLAAEAGMPN